MSSSSFGPTGRKRVSVCIGPREKAHKVRGWRFERCGEVFEEVNLLQFIGPRRGETCLDPIEQLRVCTQ